MSTKLELAEQLKELARASAEKAAEIERATSSPGGNQSGLTALLDMVKSADVPANILQSLYNLSDDQMEFQITDRLSFKRFLKLKTSDKVPDSKTIWKFRETLIQEGIIEALFCRFN